MRIALMLEGKDDKFLLPLKSRLEQDHDVQLLHVTGSLHEAAAMLQWADICWIERVIGLAAQP